MARTARVKKDANGTAHYHLMSQANDKKFLFEEGLHQCRGGIAVDELEVVPDAPPILVGIHLHADAEGVAVLGDQTVGLLLVHAPLEAEAGSTH